MSDMDDMGDLFREWNKQKKEKRTANRKSSTEVLTTHNVPFESKNGGAHLIVEGRDCKIDFWPGTGKFITRNGKNGRGVFNLIKHCDTNEMHH